MQLHLWQGIILGVIQGVGEFLPISSSGNLLFYQRLLGLPGLPIQFDLILNAATTLSIIIIFWPKIWNLFLALIFFFKKQKTDQEHYFHLYLIYGIVAVFFTGIVGILVKSKALEASTSKISLSIGFFITAVVLLIGKFVHQKEKTIPPHQHPIAAERINIWKVIMIGIVQGLAIFPGISRSGSTISTALYMNVKRSFAGEFSFIICIPSTIGAIILSGLEGQYHQSVQQVAGSTLIVTLIVAFIVGLISLFFLLRLILAGRLYYFSIYLLIIGILNLCI